MARNSELVTLEKNTPMPFHLELILAKLSGQDCVETVKDNGFFGYKKPYAIDATGLSFLDGKD